jgi:CheY-like chemotaxis protein
MAGKKREQILIIDDDADIRAYVRKVLEVAGYSVEESGDAIRGLDFARTQVPHLIILDLNMPGASGFDFLEQRRTYTELKDIPVIVLSGRRDREAVYRSISLGALNYLAKPIDAKTLIAKIREVFRDRRASVVSFHTGSRPKVTARAMGRIVSANEIGFLLQVPFKIAPETIVDVRSKLLEQLQCETCLFRKTQIPGRTNLPGQYVNEVAVIGMSPDTVERIREITRGWSKI